MEKNTNTGYGQSVANGPDAPKWAQNWEFQMVRDTQCSFWSVMA